jgi:hypothetical protein
VRQQMIALEAFYEFRFSSLIGTAYWLYLEKLWEGIDLASFLLYRSGVVAALPMVERCMRGSPARENQKPLAARI